MKHMTALRNTLLVLLTIASIGRAVAAEKLVVSGVADPSQLVPVSIEGFSGEALSVLRFDLEVAGCKITSVEEAVLRISGNNGPNLVGRVTDRNRASLLAKEYSGGPLRRRGQRFADAF